MGYMGLGMQSWITRLKPQKFLSKRSKQDGGGMEKMFGTEVKDYYHLKHRDLKKLLEKEGSDEYKKQLIKTLIHEKRTVMISNLLIFIIALTILSLVAFWLVPKINHITLKE